MGKLFDTHAHYTDEKLMGDDALLQSILAGDICNIMTVAVDLADSKSCIALAERYKELYASAGIHPHECDKYDSLENSMAELQTMLSHEKVKAIGEIGLDYYYDFSDRESQMRYFKAQMDLAAKWNLPVIIHDREAHGDTMDVISAYKGKVRGIIHSCSCSAEQVKEYVKMGWYISFSGVITFKNATKILESVKATPLDRILSETDCPYLAPVPMRGKTNNSSYMHFTAAKEAELLGVDYETFCLQEVENAKTIFQIS